jgi:dinuclear metal center YbgI/SA1388 family protein
MPHTIGDLTGSLDRLAPLAKAAGWDPVGLQLGDPAAPVSTIAVCHEVTEGVVARLERQPVDLLISYHPLLFRPATTLVAGPSAAGRAFRLVRAGVALGVVHTAFDVAPGGTADALAASLGLGDMAPFGPGWGADTVKIVTFVPAEHADEVAGAMSAAGAGAIGNYSGCSFRAEGMGTFFAGEGAVPVTGAAGSFNAEPEVRLEMIAPARAAARVAAALVTAHPYEEPAYDVYDVRANAGFIGRRGRLATPRSLAAFAADVDEALDASSRVAGERLLPVEHVAVVPGSGASFFGALHDVDVVVTGDVGHHAAREAVERGVAVVDAGHAATERPGVATLYAAVVDLVGDAVDLTGVDADPWRG